MGMSVRYVWRTEVYMVNVFQRFILQENYIMRVRFYFCSFLSTLRNKEFINLLNNDNHVVMPSFFFSLGSYYNEAWWIDMAYTVAFYIACKCDYAYRDQHVISLQVFDYIAFWCFSYLAFHILYSTYFPDFKHKPFEPLLFFSRLDPIYIQ